MSNAQGKGLLDSYGAFPSSDALGAWDGDIARLTEVLDRSPGLVHAYNGDGWTALRIAAHAGQADAVRVLLDRGADVGAHSRNGLANTPLHSAIAGWRGDRRGAVVSLPTCCVRAAVRHGDWGCLAPQPRWVAACSRMNEGTSPGAKTPRPRRLSDG
jgi:hypothetical protein